MELWSPEPGADELFEWWRPLMLASRRARAERFPYPIHLDEFRLAGRVIRVGRPDVWIYDHRANGGSVCVDDTGQAWRYVGSTTPGAGSFRRCKLADALRRAGLPEVVPAVRYEAPRVSAAAGSGGGRVGASPGSTGVAAAAARAGAHPAVADPADEPRVIRRGHLTLVSGCA
jgi:hypothetical protein